MREDFEIFLDLIEVARSHIIESEFQLDFYEGESRDPVKVGRADAEERVSLYKSHIKHWRDHLELLSKYGRKNGWVY